MIQYFLNKLKMINSKIKENLQWAGMILVVLVIFAFYLYLCYIAPYAMLFILTINLISQILKFVKNNN